MHGIAVALDVLRLDRCYEWFSHHAVAIAHRVQTLKGDIPPPPDSLSHRARHTTSPTPKAGQGDGAKYGQLGKICPAPEGFWPLVPTPQGV